jgi:hypothetical protein
MQPVFQDLLLLTYAVTPERLAALSPPLKVAPTAPVGSVYQWLIRRCIMAL